MSFTITAPNKGYSGVVAGVPFYQGIAHEVSEVPSYFTRHTGYTITQNPEEPQTPTVPDIEPVADIEPAAETKKTPAAKKSTKGSSNGN